MLVENRKINPFNLFEFSNITLGFIIFLRLSKLLGVFHASPNPYLNGIIGLINDCQDVFIIGFE